MQSLKRSNPVKDVKDVKDMSMTSSALPNRIAVGRASFVTVQVDALNTRPPIEQVVYMRLCWFLDKEGVCCPKLQELAEVCGVKKVRTIAKAIKSLEWQGLLVVEPCFKKNGGRTMNRYHPQLIGAA
jgi:hypothetical protein